MMGNRLTGIFIFLLFIVVPFLLEGGNIIRLFVLTSLLVVLGPAIGLTLANYEKGMDRQIVYKKLKKYLIVSGVLGTLLGFISVFGMSPVGVLKASVVLGKLSACFVPIFYGFLFAYIIDTLIYE